jgi:DNA polymerase-3 subunit gamma/tau
MSENLTLYRKYRPQSLDEVVGQKTVIENLKNSIAEKKITHAYLFTGSRGIGKTSIARAFAKELKINEADIYELDAASNNGVDDIKELINGTYTLPFYSEYKMYILDEVHMLSRAAANAFLKTLEEPPKHVIFVLATTDPEKLLDTILSRCARFDLKKPSIEILQNHLENICQKENIKIEAEALYAIALAGDGSFRDSLVHLQKVISSTSPSLSLAGEGQNISESQVADILGIPNFVNIFKYLKALDGITEKTFGIEAIQETEKQNIDEKLFSKTLLFYVRILLEARLGFIKMDYIQKEFGEYIGKEIEEILKNKTPKILSGILVKLLEIDNKIKNSSQPYLLYEILLLEN